jgi:hypothetical protein
VENLKLRQIIRRDPLNEQESYFVDFKKLLQSVIFETKSAILVVSDKASGSFYTTVNNYYQSGIWIRNNTINMKPEYESGI